MALSTRIITSWRRRAASPVTTTGCGSTSTRTPRSAAGLASAVDPSATTSPRSTGIRSSSIAPGVGAREEQEVLDHRRHVADLVVDVLEGGADLAHRLGAMPLEVLDAAADDRERRAQLVAGIGGEVALATERHSLVRQRLADRDERAAGVHGPEAEGHDDDHEAADEEHGEHDVERALLRGPVLDDLDQERRAGGVLDRLGEEPDRGALDLRGPDVATAREGRRRGAGVRQARRDAEVRAAGSGCRSNP